MGGCSGGFRVFVQGVVQDPKAGPELENTLVESGDWCPLLFQTRTQVSWEAPPVEGGEGQLIP